MKTFPETIHPSPNVPNGTEEGPNRPDQEPWLHLERAAEGFRCEFQAQLEATVRTQTQPRLDDVLGVLEPAHTLTLAYRIGQGKLSVRLSGQTLGASEATTIRHARVLWTNLGFLLGPTYDFAVKPATPSQLRPAPMCYELHPSATAVQIARPVGYVSAAEPLTVRVPWPAPSEYAPGNTLKLALENPVPAFELRLWMQPYHLCETERRGLGELEGRLVLPAVFPDQARWFEWFSGQLAQWRHHGRGIQFRCQVRAEGELPVVLLAQLGRELFAGRPVEVITTHDQPHGETASPALIDLGQVLPHPIDGLTPLLPVESLAQCGIPIRHSGSAPVWDDRSGLLLGETLGQRRPVRLAQEDRASHCYILGGTGTGKSTLLFNMIAQDLERGTGLCVLDPHGDLHSRVLATIPGHRVQDVVLIEPTDPKRAPGINFLEPDARRLRTHPSLVANQMIEIFDRLYDLRQTGGPIFEQYMRNALLLVMNNEIGGGTLMDVPALFENTAFRRSLIAGCTDPHVGGFWRDQAEQAHGEASLANMAPYITSKLNQFTSNAMIRPIIGQSSSTIDFGRCLDRRQILLVNLAKGLLGTHNAKLLGMIILGKLFLASLQRVDRKESEREPFYVYIDEAQSFLTDTLAEYLSEARKFGLRLILANQHLEQISGSRYFADLAQSVLGNVGTLLAFRLGPPDALRLAAYMAPGVSVMDLMTLPNHSVAARLLRDGAPVTPFVFRTITPNAPSLAPKLAGDLHRRLARRKARYTRLIEDVEHDLAKRRSSIA